MIVSGRECRSKKTLLRTRIVDGRSKTHLPAGAAAAKIAGAPTKLVGATRGPIAPVVDKRRPVHGVRAGPGQRISHRTLCVGQLPLLPSRARASVRQRGAARRRSGCTARQVSHPRAAVPRGRCNAARRSNCQLPIQCISHARVPHLSCPCQENASETAPGASMLVICFSPRGQRRTEEKALPTR